MQNWQKSRNYRKHKMPDGSIRYVITIEGMDVDVTQAVYEAYSKCDRRERYLAEKDVGRLYSIEQFEEYGISLEILLPQNCESSNSPERATLIRMAFLELKADERHLIHALIIEGMTEREYAEEIGLSQKAVNKRKHKILEKLKIRYSTLGGIVEG